MATEYKRMQQLRGTSADWGANDIRPLAGELALVLEGGRWRLKAGDGATAFSGLPYVGEVDQVARDAITTNTAAVTALGNRVSSAEQALGAVSGIQNEQVTLRTLIDAKQDEFAPGGSRGDIMAWNGQSWAASNIGAFDGAMLRFDATLGAWIPLPRGGAGQVLALSASLVPNWSSSSALTVRTITLGDAGTVAADWNALKPSVGGGDIVVVVHKGVAYIYTGPVGANLTNATVVNFTPLGSSVTFASATDFTTPAGGATAVAVSPAVLQSWAASLSQDAGTF